MMNYKTLLFCILISVISCKTDTTSATSGEAVASASNANTPYIDTTDYSNLPLISEVPDPCQLLSEEWVKANVNLNVKDLRIKPGSTAAPKDNKTCFFQWSYSNDPSAGFLVNLMTNPVPTEITEFPITYMNAKLREGESMMNDDKPYPFKRLTGVGKDAIGSFELKKYYFRNDNQVLFMLVYNLPLPEKEMNESFAKIANEVLNNYDSKVKK